MTNHIVVESHNQRKRRLAWLFASTLCSFMAGVDLLALWMADGMGAIASSGNLMFLLFLCALVGGGGLVQLVRLSADGPKVAKMLGGRIVVLEPSDQKERQFRNVATETAIAAGIPMPMLFLLVDDNDINAFAAGAKGQTTSVCVSAGALQKLSRSELQGVVAHEMAHLKHDDVALSRLLAAGLFGLLCITLLGKLLLVAGASPSARRGKENDGTALLVIGLAVLVVGAIGWLCAAVLDAAASREMELRADAEAVRMLSDSSGLVGALVKLGQQSGELPSGVTGLMRTINPMCFNAAVKRYWFDTHPPLLARIRALDPSKAAELQTTMGGS